MSAMVPNDEFVELCIDGRLIGIPLNTLAYNVEMNISSDPNKTMYIRRLDQKTRFERYKWTGDMRSILRNQIKHTTINIDIQQNRMDALFEIVPPNDLTVPETPSDLNDHHEEAQTSRLNYCQTPMCDAVTSTVKKEECEDIIRGEESQNAIIPDGETSPDEPIADDVKYPFRTKKRRVIQSDDENDTSVDDEKKIDEDDMDDVMLNDISNALIVDNGSDGSNAKSEESLPCAPSESDKEEEYVPPEKKEKPNKPKRGRRRKVPLEYPPLYDYTPREPCFTMEFVENEALSPLEFLPLLGKEEDAGMFYKWKIDGIAKFVNAGKFALPWQEPTSEDLLRSFGGYTNTFGAYGMGIWKDMGLGKTTQALMHTNLTRRMPLPGRRIPIEFEKRETFHRVVDGTVRDETERKLLKLNMFTSSMKKYLPEHPFKNYPKQRGHALLIVQNSVNTSWLSEIENNFVAGGFRVINLINHSDYYKDGDRLATEIPAACLVIVGEGRLPYIKKEIMKKLYPDMWKLEDKSKCVMPSAENRTHKVFHSGLQAIYRVMWNILIVDEAHSLRNTKSVRFKCAEDIIAHQVICLTGTPLQNKLEDLQAEFKLIGMSHCVVDNPRDFILSIDAFREEQKKKLTVKMIDELCNQFQTRVATVRNGIVAMSKEAMMEFIKHIIRTKTLAAYNPAQRLEDLFKNQLRVALDDKMKTFWNANSSYTGNDYDFSTVFHLYTLFEMGNFGKDGTDILTLDYPLLLGKANSGRKDHRDVLSGIVERPEYVNECQKFVPKPANADTLTAEIKNCRDYINTAEMMIATGMVRPAFAECQQRTINEKKKELEQLLARVDTKSTADIYGAIWKIENAFVFDMFTSYKKLMCCYTKNKMVDWDAIASLPIVDTVTLGVAIFQKFQTNERFNDVWTCSEKDVSWDKPQDTIDKRNPASAKIMLQLAKDNPFGFIWDRSVRRFGKDTHYSYCLKKEIEKVKERKGGQDLTDEELKTIQEETYMKYGIKVMLVKTKFMTEIEKKVYNLIHEKGVTNIKNFIAHGREGGHAGNYWGKIFAILTRLRQAAVNYMLLGEDDDIKDMLLVDQAFGMIMEGDVENEQSDPEESSQLHELVRSVIDNGPKKHIEITECTKLILLKQYLTNSDIIKPDSKFLIFTNFVMFAYAAQNLVHDIFGKKTCLVMTKDQNAAQRTAAVTQFNTDEKIRGFALTLKCGGTGLNLQTAKFVFLMDPWWNPQVELQAIKRADRIGKTELTTVFRFIMQDTVEEKIQEIKQEKMNLNDSVFGSSDEPCILPTNNDIKFSNTMNANTLLRLAGMEEEVGELSFDELVKTRKKKREAKMVVKKNKSAKKNRDDETSDIRNSGGFDVRKRTDSIGMTKDNFTQITNQMKVDLEDSFMSDDDSWSITQPI